jgi:two-component system, NarL family, response regulator NreC
MMTSRTRVVLGDDHTILREGLRTLIDAQPDLQVVGEAATGQDVVRCVESTTPRVVCLDLSMPGWGWATTIEKLRATSPSSRILVLTMHDDPAYVRTALSLGAAGYALKSTPATSLLGAIRTVGAGQRSIDPSLTTTVETPPPVPGVGLLSRREHEVLQLLVRGHTHQEIADKLFVSVKTIETYRARVKEKTGLITRADFVRYGRETGML